MAHLATPLPSEPSTWTRWGPGGKGLRDTVRGMVWESLGQPLAGDTAYAMVYCGNGIIVGGTAAGDLVRSTDYGITWKNLGDIIVGANACGQFAYLGNGIVIATADDAAGAAIARSTDYGRTWAVVGYGPAGSSAWAWADITYCGNGIVLVGFTGLVMRSTDYGATFTYVTDFGVLTRGLAYCGNGVVIVHTHGHEYALRSTDYGISYSRITLPALTSNSWMDSVRYFGNGVVIIASNGDQIFRSTDYGMSWTLATTSGAASMNVNGVVYLGNGCGIFFKRRVGADFLTNRLVSTDWGVTWENPTQTVVVATWNGICAIGDDTVLAWSAAGSLFRGRFIGATPPESGTKDTSAFTTITADTTIAAGDRYAVYLVSNAASRNVKLPSATACAGRRYVVKRMGAGNVMVSRTGTNTIDGVTNTAVTARYDSMELQSTGSRWLVINEVD